MKVKAVDSFKAKIFDFIQDFPCQIVLRADLVTLGSSRQVSRALKSLVQEAVLTKIGYGVYAKLVRNPLIDEPFLFNGFSQAAQEAMDRLNVQWDPGQAEQDYNQGPSSQIPVSPSVKLKSRFNRKLGYKGMTLRFE